LPSGLGITGTTKMRKDDLVAAITARQVGSAPRSEAAAQPQSRSEAERAPEPVEAPADPPKRVEQRSDSATRERTSVAPTSPQDATQTTTDTH
jgi:transcription termination factor Rho